MPRGSWIAHAGVADIEARMAPVAAALSALEAHGTRFPARGGAGVELAGAPGRGGHVVIGCPGLDAARACRHCGTHRAARKHRLVAPPSPTPSPRRRNSLAPTVRRPAPGRAPSRVRLGPTR